MKKFILLFIILSITALFFGCRQDKSFSEKTAKTVADYVVQMVPKANAAKPEGVKAIKSDISGIISADSTAKAILKGADFAAANGFNAVTVAFNPYTLYNSGSQYFTGEKSSVYASSVAELQSALTAAKEKGIQVFLEIDLFLLKQDGFAELAQVEPLLQKLPAEKLTRLSPSSYAAVSLIGQVFSELSKQLEPDGYILGGLDYRSKSVDDASEVAASGQSETDYRKSCIQKAAETAVASIKQNSGTAVVCYDTETPVLYADKEALLSSGMFDAAVGIASDDTLFEAGVPVIVNQSYGGDTYGLANEYQAACGKKNYAGSVYHCLSSLKSTRALDALKMAYENKLDNSTQNIELSISSPQNNITTEGENIVIQGTCDNNFPLLMNGNPITPTSKGNFAVDYKLKTGKNTITFEHKGKTSQLVVTYYMRVIRDISPSSDITIASENEVGFTVYARSGASVKGVINGATLTFKERDMSDYDNKEKIDDGFALFEAVYKAPSNNNGSSISIGACKVTSTYKGFTQSLTSGKVSVLDKWGPRTDGKRYIMEVTADQAETFDSDMAYSVINKALPTNVYLPKGTKDYVVGEVAYSDKGENLSYYKLACGKRVYQKDSKLYLSDEVLAGGISSVTAADNGRFTDITFDSSVKPPFAADFSTSFPGYSKSAGYFDFSCTYNTSKIDFILYNITSAGDIQYAPNELFSEAAVSKLSGNSVKLTLKLKKPGRFYGFTSLYNDSGKLVLRLFNPVTYDEQTGKFSGGFKVIVDPGHGGSDPGAPGYGGIWEKELNLRVGLKLADKLRAAGAEVLMTRTDNNTLSSNVVNGLVEKENPNLLLSVHHNASTSSKPTGTEVLYYYPFNQGLANSVFSAIGRPGKIYYASIFNQRTHNGNKILVECAYMSNADDYQFAVDNSEYFSERILQGLKNYYKG